MNRIGKAGRSVGLAAICLGFLTYVECTWAQPAADVTNEIRIVELQGTVEVAVGTTGAWAPAQSRQTLHPLDRLRTADNSRVALLWSDRSVVSFGALTEIEVLPPDSQDAQCGLHLLRGILSFFHRDKPGRIRVITRGAVAGVEGTEFAVTLDRTNRTILSVIDGKVRFGNEQATILLTNGEQAVAAPGQAPSRIAGFVVNNLLQWSFYYPAVVDLSDLTFTADEQRIFGTSFAAYRSGDLLAALAQFPAGRQSSSDSERVYYAGLLLSVGQVESAESVLASLSASDPSSHPQRIAAALRRLIAAVERQPDPAALSPQLATEYLADSYYEQSRAVAGVSLRKALDLARQATTLSPDFGFAWERLAELEFSFGNTHAALAALDKSLMLSPRNAQALALKGFLLAAQDRTGEAIGWFDRALAVDSALGNAWLGRGLCRIRNGDVREGREDLLVAAALEPQRAVLRSYLGKAYADAGNDTRAANELQRAKTLDPNDPTAWLYSALSDQQENRINDAIRDLEKSQALNDNRSVYRSQLLLDQDRAVRSANLAAMYQDAGLGDWAVNEASRAVNYDYANYSAHLFLANSFANLTDPNEINLRYETPAESEYLVANLLSPVSAGTLSPTISQQEYSPLFERNGFGVVSSTEYLSRGAWTQAGAQYGVFDNFGYDLEGFYRTDPGQRFNEGIEQRQLSAAFKYQLTPQDTAYVQVRQYNADGGDLAEYYNQAAASPTYHFDEQQKPTVNIGYHHEWAPGIHTLLLLGHFDDTYSFTNFTQPSLFQTFIGLVPPPVFISAQNVTVDANYARKLDIYSGELQQIFEAPAHTTIIGTRLQYGYFHTTLLQDNPSSSVVTLFSAPIVQEDVTSVFKRFSLYGYHEWQILEPLQLVGGVAYDRITYPQNFQSAPISGDETTASRVSPKAGVIWTPLTGTTARFAYTRSLGGATLDQSYQIEPSQVAGFIQNYRSIIPESVAGDNPGAKFETYDLSLEQRFRTGTYLSISGELLNSTVHRLDGVFNYDLLSGEDPQPSTLRENLDYTEETFLATANQLLCRDWSLGARYRLSRAVLHDDFPDVPVTTISLGTGTPLVPSQRTWGVLQELSLSATYNHPCGFFAQGEADWYHQHNSGISGDDFWQLNAYVGYRFLHRHGQVTLGLLNITDQNYNLNPLNLYNELPRSRTLLASLQFNF